jgi:hypothetical protein
VVKQGLQEHNAELVRAVYAELAALRPEGFRYTTYRVGDGRTFIHIAEHDGDGDSPLPALTAFRAFQTAIGDRCEWGPVVGAAEEVGRYRPRGAGASSGSADLGPGDDARG